jgi:hypothetical protein
MSVRQPLDDLLHRINSMLRGWCGDFPARVFPATFAYLSP